MFEEVGRASSYQFNRSGEVGIASDHHNRKRKIPAKDLFNQPPQTHAREIDRGKDASGGHCGDLAEKLLRAVISLNSDGFARQRDLDVVALSRCGSDDINDFGHALVGPRNQSTFCCAAAVHVRTNLEDRMLVVEALGQYVEAPGQYVEVRIRRTPVCRLRVNKTCVLARQHPALCPALRLALLRTARNKGGLRHSREAERPVPSHHYWFYKAAVGACVGTTI
jgi:hypothetical protein